VDLSDFLRFLVQHIPQLVIETKLDPAKKRVLGQLGAKIIYYCYFKLSDTESLIPFMNVFEEVTSESDLNIHFSIFKTQPQILLQSITQKILETRFIETFDKHFFWDMNMNLIRSKEFVPTVFVSNFDESKMRAMTTKVVQTLKDDTAKMQQVLREWSSRITFSDFESALLSLGESVTIPFADGTEFFTTIKDLYYLEDDHIITYGAPGIIKMPQRNLKRIGFLKNAVSDGFVIESTLDGSAQIIGDVFGGYLVGDAIGRVDGKQYKCRS
jgi:hypothetical protein